MATQSESGQWPAFLSQVPETWLDNYKALMSASSAITERWLKAYTAQVQSNLEVCSRLAGCKEIGEAAAIQQRWCSDTAQRVTAELEQCQEQMGALAKQGFSAMREPPSARRPTPTKAA
jgi:hypothetical protein